MDNRKPVDWDELYPGRFIKAGDLRGKQVTLTISDVDKEQLESDQGKKVKGVISFRETEKQLALNKTNGLCLREMFGRLLVEWVGKRVTIFPGEWNGEACVRVWGSPDIERDKDVEIRLPRRKPFPMTMHKVSERGGRKSAPEPPPEPEDHGGGWANEGEGL